MEPPLGIEGRLLFVRFGPATVAPGKTWRMRGLEEAGDTICRRDPSPPHPQRAIRSVMSTESDHLQPPGPEGRILLDAEGVVVQADSAAYEAFGLDGDERTLPALRGRLEAARLLPGPEAPAAWFRRVTLMGRWENVIETAFCRAPGGGWTVAVRLLRDPEERRGGLQSMAGFLATAAHELYTPLTTLKASLQLLMKRSGRTDADREELLEVALRGANRLIRLVDNLIDLTRVTSGSLDLRFDRLDPAQLMEEAVCEAAPRTGSQHVVIHGVDAPLPPVRGDGDRLRQVLVEFLHNAANCSEEGSEIEVAGRIAENTVIFTVLDHGMGIPPEHHETVFRPFFQVDGSATRDVPGLGLGLAICKGLVEMHGGKIWVEGEPGRGSTFSFSIPVAGQRDDTPTEHNN